MSATSTPRFPLREPLLRVQVSNGPSPAGSPRLVPGSPRSGWIVSRKVVGFIVTLLAGLVFCTFIYTTVSFYSVYGDSSSSTAVPSSSSSSASASSASTAVPSSALAATRPGPDDRTRAPSRQARQDAKVFQRCQHDPKAKLPDLKKVYSWRARGRRAHDGISVLTQLSVERLSMLRAQCRVWPAELNAVVYVPLMKDFGAISADVPALNGTSLTDIAHLVDQFYQDLQSDPSGHCRLNMELVVEEFDDWEDPTWSLYPTNSLRNRALTMAKSEAAAPGRAEKMPVPEKHFVNGRPLTPPFPAGMEQAQFGLGCFWGAEKYFWQLPGVYVTAVGYAGGHTANPTYKDICYLDTGHAEVVQVVFDPTQITYQMLLKTFWESHNPTQGMRQGNDVGSQYRSMIMYTTETQRTEALASKDVYNEQLSAASYPAITTEIIAATEFFMAEEYHQRYLEKNPNGYCGIGGTGVSCPIASIHA